MIHDDCITHLERCAACRKRAAQLLGARSGANMTAAQRRARARKAALARHRKSRSNRPAQ